MLMIRHNREDCWITQLGMRIICAISKVANYSNLQLPPTHLCYGIFEKIDQQIKSVLFNSLFFFLLTCFLFMVHVIYKNSSSLL